MNNSVIKSPCLPKSVDVVTADRSGGLYDYSRKFVERLGSSSNQVILSSHHDVKWGNTVFLQYSGYGFARRGAPLWLLQSLRTHRRKIETLAVFFHELYATAYPWSSAFWLSPVQRYVARELATLSDFWMTNREASAIWLSRHGRVRPNAVLPIFSNVGEPLGKESDFRKDIIVFGTPAVRAVAYRMGGFKLLKWAASNGFIIHDVGAPLADATLFASIPSKQIERHGRLSAHSVSELLRMTAFGIVAYPPAYLAKSGIFAAYAAHGVCPVVLSKSYSSSDGLEPNREYCAGLPSFLGDSRVSKRIASNARDWYEGHGVDAHVNSFKRLLAEVSK